MRYTKYNYKKNKKNELGKFILSFVAMSAFVVVVGILLANIIIYFLPINNSGKELDNSNKVEQNTPNVKDKDITSDTEKDVNTSSDSDNESVINTSFIAIQCGYFGVVDNANVALNKVTDNYGAFMLNEGDKYRVLAGVYSSSEAEEIVSKLTSNGIESTKIEFDLDPNNQTQRQISGICDGYLKVLNTAFKDDVTEVDTADFKEWTKSLEVIDESEDKAKLEELKQHIADIPNKVKKEDVSKEMQYIYTVLVNFKK